MTPSLKVAELFAGVGGFRLGVEAAGWQVLWSNQWEPSTKAQHASDCYTARFGPEGHVCDDIARVLDLVERDKLEIPDHDLVVGGFPCQDYSVAKVLSKAHGIEGRKGVLWWEILRFLRLKRPPLLLLENVDRLLKSPANQRGRDFAVMLACLAAEGYDVEWRVVNAADYGFPQRRRRVFIVGRRGERAGALADGGAAIHRQGVLARAFPVSPPPMDDLLAETPDFVLDHTDIARVSDLFGREGKASLFLNAGYMREGRVWTRSVAPEYGGPRRLVGEILLDEDAVEEGFFIRREELAAWRYLKGAKREPRKSRTGFTYEYTEGALAFPDPNDLPSRTILTGEGGRSPSRFKHVIECPSGRYRRLTPVELERLNGFPDGWTNTGMSDARRAFMMGNALVVGLIERIAAVLASEAKPEQRLPRSIEAGTG